MQTFLFSLSHSHYTYLYILTSVDGKFLRLSSKKMHNLRVASWVLFGAKMRTVAQEAADQDSSERLLQKGSSVQFSSIAQSYPTLCDPMNRSTPGLHAHHQLPEFIQAHVHSVGDAIQPSHPLSSPSPSTFNLPSIRVFSNESVLRIRWPKY